MGKALREEKGEDLRGEKALGGKGGKGSQQGMGENILGRKKEEKGYDLRGGGGGKGLGGERGGKDRKARRSQGGKRP